MFRFSAKKSLFRSVTLRSLFVIQRDGHINAGKVHQRVTRLWGPGKSSFRSMCSAEQESDEWKTVYEGPISGAVRNVKMLSLTTMTGTFIASPVMIFFGKQSVSMPIKFFLVGLFCSIAGGSTALLHWVSKPYVRKMYFNPEEKRFAVETLSWYAGRKRTEFSVDDIEVLPDDRAFSTFVAHGVTYFIHREVVEAQQVLHFIEKQKREQYESADPDV